MASDVYDKGAPLAEAVFYLIINSFRISYYKKCSTKGCTLARKENVAKATRAGA